MFVKTSRMLSACAFAALVLAAAPAHSGGHGAKPAHAPQWSYHGRHAGPGYLPVAPAKFGHVNVYRGGQFAARFRAAKQAHAHPLVTVYYGGGVSAGPLISLDEIDALNVVTVTRGASRRSDHPAVIVTRGLTLTGGVGHQPD
jgi:hypothetical protein